jgi:hypothetical protein
MRPFFPSLFTSDFQGACHAKAWHRVLFFNLCPAVKGFPRRPLARAVFCDKQAVRSTLQLSNLSLRNSQSQGLIIYPTIRKQKIPSFHGKIAAFRIELICW